MKSVAALLSFLLPAFSLWAGSPLVTRVTPAAGQRGTETEIVLAGSRLVDARTLLFNGPGIECVGISDAKTGSFKAKLKIAPDARIGEHIFRAITNSGIADTRLFYVTPYPVQKEADEEKGDPYKPQPAPLGVTIYGTIPGEDQDHFEVEAKKGQRISAEVVGVRITTQAVTDAYLSITKADGTVLAEADDSAFTRQDPALSVIAPEDGKYRVIIRDSTNSGQGDASYLLHIGSHPRPLTIFPLGGMAGQELKATLIGDAGGLIEQSVKLPAEPIDRFEVVAQKDGLMAPQPNFLRVSPFPNVLEVEPNNDASKATPAGSQLPLAFNGIIQEKGDTDFFKFTAQKGAAYNIRVYARVLRSPLDPVLEIHDAAGKRLALNDDSGEPDSYLRWAAPADGEFCIQVHDQLMRGGPLYTYRVEATPVQPMLSTYLPEMVQNSSQQRRAIVVPKGNRFASLVRLKRTDVAGDAILEPRELPAGVSAVADKCEKSVDAVAMVFEASPDAASAEKRIEILPKLSEPPKDSAILSKVEHLVEVSENGNQRPYYTVEEDRLAIAVTDEVPVSIECAQPKVPILQSGSMNLKVVAERRKDFKGPIQFQVLYAPPGIGTPGVVTIPEGKNEGQVTISANGSAPLATWKTCVIASADLGNGPVWISSRLIDLEVAAPFVSGTLVRTYIDQDSEGSMTLKLEQKVPFDGKAKVALVGLPQGVTSEEREITKDDKEVRFPLKATPTAQVGQHKTIFASFTLLKDGEPMTNTIASAGILRVDKASPPAKVADAKP
jgi:hypothetical protein